MKYDAIAFKCHPEVFGPNDEAFICCHCGVIRDISQWYKMKQRCECGAQWVEVANLIHQDVSGESVVPMSIQDFEQAMTGEK